MTAPRVRALPLWQPWATLVVIGAKQIETRPKPAPSTILGQRVAIHACATDAHLHRCHDVFYPIALDEPVPWKASQGICFVPAEAAGFEAAQGALL